MFVFTHSHYMAVFEMKAGLENRTHVHSIQNDMLNEKKEMGAVTFSGKRYLHHK
jgi:hypothetical protein